MCHSRAGFPAGLRIAHLSTGMEDQCVLRSMTSFYVANRLARSIIDSGLAEARYPRGLEGSQGTCSATAVLADEAKCQSDATSAMSECRG